MVARNLEFGKVRTFKHYNGANSPEIRQIEADLRNRGILTHDLLYGIVPKKSVLDLLRTGRVHQEMAMPIRLKTQYELEEDLKLRRPSFEDSALAVFDSSRLTRTRDDQYIHKNPSDAQKAVVGVYQQRSIKGKTKS